MKKTFIHQFTDGSTCTLTMDFTGNKPEVKAAWSSTDVPWCTIEYEYKQWRTECFNTFMGSLELEDMLKVSSMLLHR